MDSEDEGSSGSTRMCNITRRKRETIKRHDGWKEGGYSCKSVYHYSVDIDRQSTERYRESNECIWDLEEIVWQIFKKFSNE